MNASAVITAFDRELIILERKEWELKPAKTTLCIMPSRQQLSMVTTRSGVMER